ncbi:hypothetical protein [Knoellia sp. Soil729]|uniref:hypothetical protein n=1 Tax=Knoellia sp. Soil729 TaxID=1736394 RepID=UPI000AC35E30|nr:hypothetical protein [Knoellia sp. Soil729]
MSGFCVPRRVAFVIPGDSDAPEVFLMQLPDGPPVVLHGASAVIWVLAADGEEDVVAEVGRTMGVARDMLEGDVTTHLRDLVDRGWLLARSD